MRHILLLILIIVIFSNLSAQNTDSLPTNAMEPSKPVVTKESYVVLKIRAKSQLKTVKFS